jgi:NDP-sugar pyrophosphorylase family protein
VPVAGQPLIHRIVRWLSAYGVRDLVLNLHHRPETIARAVGDGSPIGVRVRYSWEDPILGSAGGPRHALPLIDAPVFLIVNGDTLTDLDLRAMWSAHVNSEALVTMALIENPRPEHYGGVLVDEARRVTGFSRAGAAPRSYHFIGVQIASASVFAPLADNHYAESVNAVYPELIASRPGAVRAYVSGAAFRDVGTPRDYLETALSVAAEEGGRGSLLGRNARIDPTAAISASVLWDDVVVGARSRLTRCVLADGVRVPEDSTFAHSAIVAAADGTPVATPLT